MLNALFSTTAINAGNLPNQNAGGVDSSSLQHILTIVFGVVGSLAFLVIVLAGLRYITAAGDAQKTAEAKNTIVYALVGLVIAIAAEAIVAFVVNKV